MRLCRTLWVRVGAFADVTRHSGRVWQLSRRWVETHVEDTLPRQKACVNLLSHLSHILLDSFAQGCRGVMVGFLVELGFEVLWCDRG